MEEKAVLRVRDRISAALTVPYVRRAVWLMAGGLAGFLTARGLVFGKYAPFAAAGAAAAPFSTMWRISLPYVQLILGCGRRIRNTHPFPYAEKLRRCRPLSWFGQHGRSC